MTMRAAVEPFAGGGLEGLVERSTVHRPLVSIRPSIPIERIALPYRRAEATVKGDGRTPAAPAAAQRMASRAVTRRGTIVTSLVVLVLLVAGVFWWHVAGDHGRPTAATSVLPSGGTHPQAGSVDHLPQREIRAHHAIGWQSG